MSLRGKRALVTGSSRGIGRGIALKLAEQGVKTAIHYYKQEEAANETLAQVRLDQIKKAGDNLYFAWAGSEQPGGPHYYRIQSPAFLIEYDDTQNNANHIHSVWRDFNGDFGLDLLQQHYQTSHK